MEPIVVKGIEVFRGPAPDGYELIKVYDRKQGILGMGYSYLEIIKGCIMVGGKGIAKKRAKRDSESDKLLNKAIDLALEQTVDVVLQDNEEFGLGITAVAEPMRYASRAKVRKLDQGAGYQGALTIWLNIAGYRKH